MSYTEHYADYKWIKVKRFIQDMDELPGRAFIRLQAHHLEETNFLINEIRKLAAMLDEEKAYSDELFEKLQAFDR